MQVQVYAALSLTLVVQLVTASYVYGRLTEKVISMDRRVARLEKLADAKLVEN